MGTCSLELRGSAALKKVLAREMEQDRTATRREHCNDWEDLWTVALKEQTVHTKDPSSHRCISFHPQMWARYYC